MSGTVDFSSATIVGTLPVANGGTGTTTGTATGANPTGTIGLSVVNGSAGTFLRSDGAQALSQSIAPTWTGVHLFDTGKLTLNNPANTVATTLTTAATTAAQTITLPVVTTSDTVSVLGTAQTFTAAPTFSGGAFLNSNMKVSWTGGGFYNDNDAVNGIRFMRQNQTTVVVSIDTIDSRVGINTIAPGAELDVSGSIQTSSVAGKISADGAYDRRTAGTMSIGTSVATAITLGKTTTGTTAAGLFTAGRHIATSGTAPTIVAGAGAGGTPGTPTVTGTDTAGNISVITGTLPTASATIATITFNVAYASAPRAILLTPANAATALLSGAGLAYANQASATTALFIISSGTVGLVAATTYQWFYTVIQ